MRVFVSCELAGRMPVEETVNIVVLLLPYLVGPQLRLKMGSLLLLLALWPWTACIADREDISIVLRPRGYVTFHHNW